MKKAISLVLVLITLLMLCACGSEKETKTTVITDYNIDGNVEVHSCSCRVVDNGNTQYTLEFTAAAGKSITVFSPPDGDIFTNTLDNTTTGAKETLVFELTPEELAQVTEITISFCDDSSYDFVYFWAPKEG